MFRSLFAPRGARGGLIDRLPSNLTINGTTVVPSIRYLGREATGSIWTPNKGLGINLDLEAGTAPDLQQTSADNLSGRDKSVLYNEGGYHQSDETSVGNITTEDFVFETVFKSHMDASTNTIASKRDGANAGWSLICSSANDLRMIFETTGAAVVQPDTNGLADATWFHAMLFVNRDEASANGAVWYINGVANGGGDDVSAASASLTNSAPLGIGSTNTGTALYGSNIALVSMWKQAAWHQAGASGPAEWVDIALARAEFLGFA